MAQETRFYKAPARQSLGTLVAGAPVIPGRSSGSAMEVTIEGWMAARSLGPLNRSGFNAAVTRRPSEDLRESPSGTLIARVTTGTGFMKLESKGDWTRVRRTAWVDQKAMPAGAPAAAALPPGTDRIELGRRAPLAGQPAGTVLGSLDSGTAVRLLARAGGWSRVQVEAWVPDSVLSVTAPGVLVGVTQAEVRAAPARFVGAVVEWRVQFVAVQKADELRPEIPEGASYLLTRGPLPEPGFVYIIVPADKTAQFEALPALRELVVRGRIRSATTKYLPTPVLELVAVVDGMGQ